MNEMKTIVVKCYKCNPETFIIKNEYIYMYGLHQMLLFEVIYNNHPLQSKQMTIWQLRSLV